VKRDSQAVEAEFRSPVNQLRRLVRNSIRRIVRGMGVEVDFQHRWVVFHKSCRVLNSREVFQGNKRRPRISVIAAIE
jgi:hypothetical protein